MVLPFPIPSFLSSAFSISRCTIADVDDLAEIYYCAFQVDRRNTFWWSEDKEAMMTWMKRRIRKKMADRSTRHFKVTDVQSGEMVAFTRWDIPEGHETAFGAWEEDLPANSATPSAITPPMIDIPEGAQPELCLEFFNALSVMSEKQNAKEMLGLSLLCTSPNYHRRGAAKAMMLPMLALADTRGLKAYLEATPDGKPIYEKLGFREIDQLNFDLEKLTGTFEGIYKISIMVREPKPI
ncbi:acyl-CoA N-acyltransferase [Annulohypoxylon maeteangense]|uniref:acyl-CoA N-acyltransferase n=1 Tax=Annulohypoxylon maeteangense TaxID=1927788 RepID=UPI0020081B17|nr:acyl-CoA N-acyltransferase [Annulohypoxylon maeteangense]KAI0881644.1 acyl-CoA N-acyltransferase [Annulohypoxylon maeteangense]